MCGIIGYIGRNSDPRIGLEALKRLEYRGYDSSGMSYYDPEQAKLVSYKAVGKIVELENKLDGKELKGSPFIFQTRWATHGAPIEKNAHPHSDCKGELDLVHNGIIENHRELREWLVDEGHGFKSDTDTEVLPHLIEHFFQDDLTEAVYKALQKVRGTYGIAVISSRTPDELVAARLGSPLLVGIGEDEYFLSSDPAGILAHTKQVVYLQENEIVTLKSDSIKIISQDHEEQEAKVDEIEWDIEEAQKGGYEHFMLKEIMEQPQSLEEVMRGRLVPEEGTVKLGGLELAEDQLKEIKKLYVVACGTAAYAGLAVKYMIEEYAGIPVDFEFGSEFRYRKHVFEEGSAALFISQSGETADTIAPLREAKKKGLLTLGIVNVVGSTLARETDQGIYLHCGPEIAVASTKALTSMMTACVMLAVYLGRQRRLSLVKGRSVVEEIAKLPKHVEQILKNTAEIEHLAEKYKDSSGMFYLGRKYSYPAALEGALKLKEISYLHAEGYAGGEMKHGPLALIQEDFPTFGVMPLDSVYEKMVSNMEEAKARQGPIIALTTEGNEDIKHLTEDVMYIPKTLEMLTPILAVVPLQLFAYHIGVLRNLDVDKPRNLAKSVTVE